jgi:putative selenate reductase
MVDLVPCPFPKLVSRMFEELAKNRSIFDLKESKFFLGPAAHDLAVQFHGKRASSPLGPAAGPHSQLAQNIVLAWLGGSRIIELKTVQILDQLEIPRPCIDMRNIGYNVEWSQELRLAQSLEEYVKASMLIDMLAAELDVTPGFDDVIYDMSVGYDLAGIQSAPVQTFIRGMMDASEDVERLRLEIPDAYAHLRDFSFKTKLSDTLTLSTFHGCPPDEIEKIIDYLLREVGLHCVIKLNPTLLGEAEVARLLNAEMGYGDITVPSGAFLKDTRWDQAVGFIERLQTTAQQLDLGFGIKFSNTLIVEHDGVFLPATEKEKYLSGPPLHVLAINLVARLRERFGNTVPISFSAGIDKTNFADAVALGLTPITVCSDMLKPGGYGRQVTYAHALTKRMDAVGARTVDEFILGVCGLDGASRDAAILHNTQEYVRGRSNDPHYSLGGNSRLPKKVGSKLELFDCLTCDICVPVCPNDANFPLTIAPRDVPSYVLRQVGDAWHVEDRGVVALAKKHQIATFADFCNECGNCDIFCPEDGGPYLSKPRFFGSEAEWRKWSDHDGFFVEQGAGSQRVFARFGGSEFVTEWNGGRVAYSGDGFEIEFESGDPTATVEGQATGDVDMRWYHIVDVLRESVCESGDVNWASV